MGAIGDRICRVSPDRSGRLLCKQQAAGVFGFFCAARVLFDVVCRSESRASRFCLERGHYTGHCTEFTTTNPWPSSGGLLELSHLADVFSAHHLPGGTSEGS